MAWHTEAETPEKREVRRHEDATGTLITNLGFLEFR